MASVSKRTWTSPAGVKLTAWAVRYVDREGTHRSRQFDKKKEADVYRLDVENELAAGKHIPKWERVTVKQMCDLFLKEAEVKVRDGRIGKSRYQNLSQAIDVAIIPALGARVMRELVLSDIEDLYNGMIRRGLKPITAINRLQALQLVEDFGVRRGHIAERIVPEAMRPLRRTKRDTIRTFALEDMQNLIAVLDGPKPPFKHERAWLQLRCMVYLAALCGLRWGEIMGLTLPNVDFDGGLIRVRHSILADDTLKGPKSKAGIRTVGLPQSSAELLKIWLARYYIKNKRELLFRTRSGGMLSPGSFHQHDWRPLLKLAGLGPEVGDSFHFHALRHFAASWRIEQGMSLTDVATDMGHATFDTTLQVYAHPIMGAQRRHEAVEKMAVALLSSRPLLPSP